MSHKKAKRQRQERKRQTGEIRAALAEQLRLLAKRCAEFDAGDWGEAGDIATRLRVIFHPGSPAKHPSILQSLDAQKVPILNTTEPIEDSDNIIEVVGGLYAQEFAKDEHGMYYELRALLGDSRYGAEAPAFRWWDQTVNIVAANAGKHVYRRKDVVLGVANFEGGTHLAGRIPDFYDVLSRPGGIITIRIGQEGDAQDAPIVGVHLAMLRQVAFEALNSPALHRLAEKGAW